MIELAAAALVALVAGAVALWQRRRAPAQKRVVDANRGPAGPGCAPDAPDGAGGGDCGGGNDGGGGGDGGGCGGD